MDNFDLLDEDLGELSDLEGFEPIPVGTYRLQIDWDTKEVNDKPAVIMAMKVLEVEELEDVTIEPETLVGKENDMLFILKKDDGERNKIAEGELKNILIVLQESFGGGTSKEIMDNTSGAEIVATLSIRVNKNNPDQKFNKIMTLAAPE